MNFGNNEDQSPVRKLYDGRTAGRIDHAMKQISEFLEVTYQAKPRTHLEKMRFAQHFLQMLDGNEAYTGFYERYN